MQRNIVSIFSKACLADLDGQFEPIAKKFIQQWEDKRNAGLLLCGPNGVGKSYAAAAIMNTLIQRVVDGIRISGAFMTSPLVYERYHSATKHDYFDEYRGQQWWETLNTVDILVWNDLGKENRTGRYQAQVIQCFGQLLRHRIENGLSTIFTTNLNIDEDNSEFIKTVFGQDFWSLLARAAPLRYDVLGKDRGFE